MSVQSTTKKIQKLTAKYIQSQIDVSEATAKRIKQEIKLLYPNANWYNSTHLEKYLE